MSEHFFIALFYVTRSAAPGYIFCRSFFLLSGLPSQHVKLRYILSLVSVYTHPYFMTGLRPSLNMYPKTDTQNASLSGALESAKRAKRSTIGKKTWLSIHPRNFGSDKIVRLHAYVHPFMWATGDEILHFNHAFWWGKIARPPRLLERKNNNCVSRFFLGLNFTVCSVVDNGGRAISICH